MLCMFNSLDWNYWIQIFRCPRLDNKRIESSAFSVQ